MFQAHQHSGGHEAATGRVTAAVLERGPGVERDFGPELAVLRLGSDADLARLLPRMRFDLRSTPVRVTDLTEGPTVASLVADRAVPEPEAAAAWGAALGGWHLGSARSRELFATAAVGPCHEPLVDLTADPLLRACINALAREWRVETVIHGDCRAEAAALVGERHGCGGDRAVLTHWHRSGAGDPAWDLGCLVADLFEATVGHGPASGAEPAISSAIAGYARAGGPMATPEPFARRVVLATVARLTADAHDAAVVQGDPVRAGEVLALARSVAAWSPTWAERFGQWLS